MIIDCSINTSFDISKQLGLYKVINKTNSIASQSMIQSFLAMAASVGIVMHNAASNQKNGQIISTASTSVTCTMIIKKGGGGGGGSSSKKTG